MIESMNASLGIFLGFILTFFAIKTSHMQMKVRKIVFGGYFIFSAFAIVDIITYLMNTTNEDIIGDSLGIIVTLMAVGFVIALMIMELKNIHWFDDKTITLQDGGKQD